MLQFDFYQLSRRILSAVMRFIVGGEAEHYTFGASAAFLLLLVLAVPFAVLLGSTYDFFFCRC